MAITYRLDPKLLVRTPILHEVIVDKAEPWFAPQGIRKRDRAAWDKEVIKWCKENCKAKFYLLPSWDRAGVEFEDDEDAVMFALRWK